MTTNLVSALFVQIGSEKSFVELTLREIKERIKAATPQPQKEEVFARVDNVSKQVKKSKKFLLENPKKKKKLESLLAQIEKLLEVES